MSRFSAVVVLWFSTEAAEAALLLFDRFIAIEKNKKIKNDFRIPRQILSRNQNKNLSADWSVGNLRGKTIKTKLIYLDPKSLIFEKSKTFMIYQGEAGCRSNSSGNSRTWEKAALVNDSQTHTHVHCQCLVRHYQVTMVVCASARQPLLHMILWKQAHNVWKNRSKVQISGKFKILNFKLKSHDFWEFIQFPRQKLWFWTKTEFSNWK